MSPTINVQMLHPDAQLPRYAHTGPYGDLAADLHCVATVGIASGQTLAIPTGLALGFPAGYGGLILDRSSLALRGLHTLAGVIDPGYRGEIKVIMTNLGLETQMLAAGARIAQLRIVPLVQAVFELTQSHGETERHGAGFGSTGI